MWNITFIYHEYKKKNKKVKFVQAMSSSIIYDIHYMALDKISE